MSLLTAHATDESLWKTVGENIPVLRKSADQEWPAVAYNTQDNEYLVVWQDLSNFDTTRSDVYARRIAADGMPIGDAFPVTRQALNQNFPRVAYNLTRNEYLVVWSDQRDVRTTGSDVYGQRVGADGSLIGGDIAVSIALRPQLYPRVAHNVDVDEYLVVWQDSRTNATSSSDVFGQRVAGDGSLLGTNFVISDNSEAQNKPDVAYSSASQRYLMVWDDERGVDLTGVDYPYCNTNLRRDCCGQFNADDCSGVFVHTHTDARRPDRYADCNPKAANSDEHTDGVSRTHTYTPARRTCHVLPAADPARPSTVWLWQSGC